MSSTESFVHGNRSEEMQWCFQLLVWVFGSLWQLLGMDSAGATGTPFARQKWNGWCFLILMIFELSWASQQSLEFPLGERRNYNFHVFWHFSLSSWALLIFLLINKSHWKPWGWCLLKTQHTACFYIHWRNCGKFSWLSCYTIVSIVPGSVCGSVIRCNLAKSNLLRFNWG